MNRFYNRSVFGGDDENENENMQALDNAEDSVDVNNEGLFARLKKKWDSYPWFKWIILAAIVALIIGAIVLIIILSRKKEGFGMTVVKPKSTKSKETFVMVNDIDQNSYVNSYIAATRGNLV